MIKVDQLMHIKQLHAEGHSIRDIARVTGHARNTVRKVLRGEHELVHHLFCKSTGVSQPQASVASRRLTHPGIAA